MRIYIKTDNPKEGEKPILTLSDIDAEKIPLPVVVEAVLQHLLFHGYTEEEIMAWIDDV